MIPTTTTPDLSTKNDHLDTVLRLLTVKLHNYASYTYINTADQSSENDKSWKQPSQISNNLIIDVVFKFFPRKQM